MNRKDIQSRQNRLDFIRQNRHLSKQELAQLTGKSVATIADDFTDINRIDKGGEVFVQKEGRRFKRPQEKKPETKFLVVAGVEIY